MYITASTSGNQAQSFDKMEQKERLLQSLYSRRLAQMERFELSHRLSQSTPLAGDAKNQCFQCLASFLCITGILQGCFNRCQSISNIISRWVYVLGSHAGGRPSHDFS